MSSADVGALVERVSGLVVPAHLQFAPDAAGPATTDARDADGRRRVVLLKDVRKRFSRMARHLDQEQVAFVLVCRTQRSRTILVRDAQTGASVPTTLTEPIPGACGQVMTREGEDTPDPGFGCACTRIHFTQGC